MFKKGFTLVEVLITLSILGIIAAISIPNIVRNYQRRATVVKVKRMASLLSNAYQQFLIDNSKIDFNLYPNSMDGSTKAFNDIIKPYIQISYDAGTNTTNKRKIMPSTKYKDLKNNTKGDYSSSTNYYAVQFKDKTTLVIRGKGPSDNRQGIYFIYYVKGKDGENILGKDLFQFSIRPSKHNEISFYSEDYSFNSLSEAADSCLSLKTGTNCTAWIITKGNMDYLNY